MYFPNALLTQQYMLDHDDDEKFLHRIDFVANDMISELRSEQNETQVHRHAGHAYYSEGVLDRTN